MGELRAELEKRGLSKRGAKHALVKRLEEYEASQGGGDDAVVENENENEVNEKDKEATTAETTTTTKRPPSPPPQPSQKKQKISSSLDTLHITNLTRPFHVDALKELLGKYGNFSYFWIDEIKSNCFVRYTPQEAQEAVVKLNGFVWPEHNERKLNVELVSYQDEGESVVAATEEDTRKENIPTTTTTTTINTLFRKTLTQPAIYYLPLTDDQVALKKK